MSSLPPESRDSHEHFKPRVVLAAVDVDPLADQVFAHRVVDMAVDVARANGARVVIAHAMLPVVSLPILAADAGSATARAMNDVLEARAATARERMSILEQYARDAGIEVEVRIAEMSESVPHAICDLATLHQADVVVVASHHRHSLARMVLGSVAAKVAEICPVPVLLIPPPHEAAQRLRHGGSHVPHARLV